MGIREVWISNLRRLIGDRTLKEVSAGADVPYRTMQNMLIGAIAYDANLGKLAQFFGVPETELFQDPDLLPKPDAQADLHSLRLRCLTRLAAMNDPEFLGVSGSIAALLGVPGIDNGADLPLDDGEDSSQEA